MTRHNKNRGEQGFSMVELMVVVAILIVVMGIVVQGITQMQRRNAAESAKVDMTQSARDFLDQTVRDLHQAGYPNARMYANPPAPAINQLNIAAGLVSVTANSIQFEGDTDANGIVQSVTIQMVGANGNVGTACPCTLQRGRLAKVAGSPFQTPAGAQGVPVFFTELSNLQTNNPFTAYDQFGFVVPLPIDLNTAPVVTASPASPVTIASIRTIRISVNAQTPGQDADLQDKVSPIISMNSEVKINN